MKVTLLLSFILALPWVFYQAWAFIAPGLYAHEKRLALPLVLGSTLLFLIGMAFCYFFVFGMVFKFIAEFAPKSIVPAPDIEQYLSFVMSMFMAFGITFAQKVAFGVFSTVFIVLMFISILIYGMWVATGVATEKSSRVMELMISAAKRP